MINLCVKFVVPAFIHYKGSERVPKFTVGC